MMLFGHLVRNRHLLITYDDHNLSCSIIAASSGRAPYTLVAYQRFTLSHHEIMQLRIFNISALSNHIDAFIKAHNAHHSFISCALTGSGLTELIMRAPEPRLSATMLIEQSPDPLIWDSCYLYPTNNALHTFYVCGIRRELLLQYQILARMSHITISTLTSSWYAHLALYIAMQGSAFRRPNLAHTLSAHNHQLNNVLNRDMIARMITIPSHCNNDIDLPLIRTALGLFIIGTSHG